MAQEEILDIDEVTLMVVKTGTKGAVTVTTALPLTAPLVAVMVPVPAQTPVTSPELLTVTTQVLLDVQVIVGDGFITAPL